VREQPMASGSAFDAGRCQVIDGSVVLRPRSSIRTARAVDSSTSRVRNQVPETIAFLGPRGPPLVQGSPPPGSSGGDRTGEPVL
jgi:hypothetical protein